jgi:type II secretory pathway pseudopilin PulG
MVALVISGIVAGVVFDLMLGQTRFARYQNAREEVQQNARAALEVISAELRGVPPAAILAAGTNNIQFRLPRAWGILCTAVTPATTTVSVRFPKGLFPADMPSAPVPVTWGIAVQAPNLPAGPATWAFVTGISAPANVSCDLSLQESVPAAENDDRSFTGPAVGVTAPVGSPVFVWQEISYDLNTSSIPGNWIRRNTQPTPQPMAGPVPALSGPNAGLQFTYRTANDIVLLPPVPPGDIASIAVEVRTESRAKFNGAPQLQTASTQVYLRNRN